MGILDVAVGDLVHRSLRGSCAAIDRFFYDATRF